MPLTPQDIVVTTDWLDQHRSDPDLRILDGTWHLPTQNRDAVAEYASAHIPGAQFFDIDGIADRSIPLPHMVPSVEQFQEQVSALGIGNDAAVVVYDNSTMLSSARVWWLLRAMGLTRVAVLDGGLPKWLAEGREVASGVSVAKPATLTAMLDADRVKDKDQVLAATSDPNIQIVDARPEPRFRGEAPEPRAGLRSGHIPGSFSVFYRKLMNDDGTLKSDDQLRAAFESAGVDLERPIITTCGSGVTASVLYLALEKIGHDNLSLYDGSWAEWGQNDDLPLQTG